MLHLKMKQFITALLVITAALVLNACQKDSDVFVPDPGQPNGPDTSWYSVITPAMPVSSLTNALAFGPYTDSIQVSANNAYLITPFGLTCGFPGNCCVNTVGQPVTGTVNVELTLIKKKGDMIRLNKPTVSGNRLLVSGGEIYIRLKKNGQELQLAPNVKITFRYTDIPLLTPMKLFAGDESIPGIFNWQLLTDLQNNSVTIVNPNYEIQTNKTRWINNAQYFDTTGFQQVKLSVDLASQFTNANTIAFAVFHNMRSVVALNPDLATRKFTSIRLPVGKEVTLVVISKQANDYFMGTKTFITATPATNIQVQNVPVTPVIKTLSAITDYLITL